MKRHGILPKILSVALLGAAIGLLSGCNLLQKPKTQYTLTDAQGNPLCGGQLAGELQDPSLIIRNSFKAPRLFSPSQIQTLELQQRGIQSWHPQAMVVNYQQGQLPDGLVPIVVPSFTQFVYPEDDVQNPPPPPGIRGPWNPPNVLDLYPGLVGVTEPTDIRNGFLITLLDPNTMQVVRQSSYGWYFLHAATTAAAGPDGYIYVVGRTNDRRRVGDGNGGTNPEYQVVNPVTRYGEFQAFLLKIDPETMAPVWEARLTLPIRGRENDLIPGVPLYDPIDRVVLVPGMRLAQGDQGYLFRVDAQTGQVVDLLYLMEPAFYLYWTEEGPQGRQVYTASAEDVMSNMGTRLYISRLAVERYSLPPLRSGNTYPDPIWSRSLLDTTYLPWGETFKHDSLVQEFYFHVIGVYPAPEGGLNFAVRYGFAGDYKFTIVPMPFPEKAGLLNAGLITALGRISPDGSWQAREERLFPIEAGYTPGNPWQAYPKLPRGELDIVQREASSAIFLEKNGRTAVLFGLGAPGLATTWGYCYYDKILVGPDQPNALDPRGGFPPIALAWQENWDPSIPVTGKDRPLYLNTPELEYEWDGLLEPPQRIVKTRDGSFILWRMGMRKDPTPGQNSPYLRILRWTP